MRHRIMIYKSNFMLGGAFVDCTSYNGVLCWMLTLNSSWSTPVYTARNLETAKQSGSPASFK